MHDITAKEVTPSCAPYVYLPYVRSSYVRGSAVRPSAVRPPAVVRLPYVPGDSYVRLLCVRLPCGAKGSQQGHADFPIGSNNAIAVSSRQAAAKESDAKGSQQGQYNRHDAKGNQHFQLILPKEITMTPKAANLPGSMRGITMTPKGITMTPRAVIFRGKSNRHAAASQAPCGS